MSRHVIDRPHRGTEKSLLKAFTGVERTPHTGEPNERTLELQRRTKMRAGKNRRLREFLRIEASTAE